MANTIKVGVVGTGAVGGYFGGKLSLGGAEVVFLSRGKTLETLKRDGLIIHSSGEKFEVKNAAFTDNPAALSGCDYILFTVKSYDTQATIDQIKPHVSKHTIIVTPQNGVSNDELLCDAFGKERVIPGMAKIGVNTLSPGVITHLSLGIIQLGEYDGMETDRLIRLKKAFENAGVECVVSKTIQLDRWKKFIWNCTFNIVASITGLTLDRILDDAVLHDLCEKVMHELKTVAEAEGIDFGDEDVIKVRFEYTQKLGAFKPSTLEDVEKGKPIELDAFTGTILKLAEKHKIDVPVNQTLYAALHGITINTQ